MTEDAQLYEQEPFTEDEAAIDAADDWGSVEDWVDWTEVGRPASP
jgi:hypothetical protein